MPPMFHWSKAENRERISRSGLRPTHPTATPAWDAGTVRRDGAVLHRESDESESFLAVCLGWTPSHAWNLCGAIPSVSTPGEAWDLWQVVLDEGDRVYPLEFEGFRLEEVRVRNRIPKSRVWFVGSRTVARLRWSAVVA